MNISEIIQKSILIRDYLKYFNDHEENKIDTELLPVPPFKVSNEIKLIIIGQDPTIRHEELRIKIDTTLNLDKSGALKTYIEKICKILEIEIENIYATNVFKYFYKIPPADTLEILQDHLAPNLKLLNDEIEPYKKVPIITLGEPVLKLLIKKENPKKMTYYWDYNSQTKSTDGEFKYSLPEENLLSRTIFPIPHQPSSIKEFYFKTFEKYILFIKEKASYQLVGGT